LEAAVASVEQTAIQETQEEVQIEDVADIQQVLATAQEALETANASVEAAVDAAVEVAVERAAVVEKAEAERLSPDQVAALAATGPENAPQAQDVMGGSFQQDMAQQASTTFEESAQGGQGIVSTQMRFEASASASFSNAVSGSGSSGFDAAVSFSSPMSVASNFEIINNIGSRPVVTAPTTTTDQSNNEMAEGQSDTIAEMGSVPAFDAYRQASLSDRADFYAIRDIYRNRRLRDANFEMYRMTQTNDAKWREIVDAQYK
jgi:2-oxoglutarate dehydrogenase complex dehydrogenase (E1) component-like enzyme